VISDWDGEPDDYHLTDYDKEQMSLPQSARWKPAEGTLSARYFYGKHVDQTAFVIGTGPSIKKVEGRIDRPLDGAFRVALNAAITRVAAEYWFFIDLDTYLAYKDHPNARAAKAVGVDRFWKHYGPEVHVWERAYELGDIKQGRIVHRSTSLIAALHFSCWLGASRIVTVGCDNRVIDRSELTEKQRICYPYTFKRINRSLLRDVRFWKPSWTDLYDASDGELALSPTILSDEVKRLEAGNGRIVRA